MKKKKPYSMQDGAARVAGRITDAWGKTSANRLQSVAAEVIKQHSNIEQFRCLDIKTLEVDVRPKSGGSLWRAVYEFGVINGYYTGKYIITAPYPTSKLLSTVAEEILEKLK